jgi:type IV secretory pathway TrbL component
MGTIDLLTQSFLNAIERGGTSLAIYALLILGVAATIAYYKEYIMVLMHGTGAGDALASLLVFSMAAMVYYWVCINLWGMGMAVLGTAIQWGTAASGYPFSMDVLRKPSFILEIGLKVAFPSLEMGSFLQKMWAAAQMAMAPVDAIIGWFIVGAFAAVLLHHIMMLVEFFLAMICGYVLIPWGIWGFMAPLAEFGVGWFFGGFIRAFLSMMMGGLARPSLTTCNRLRATVLPIISKQSCASCPPFSLRCCAGRCLRVRQIGSVRRRSGSRAQPLPLQRWALRVAG